MRHRMLWPCLLAAIWTQVVSAEEPTFYPKLRTAWIPRGTAQLLKPYLPAPEGSSANYRFVVETPDYVKFITTETMMGSPPKDVQVSPGETRGDTRYTKHTLCYDLYPSSGFELSMCWQTQEGSTLCYQPAIRAGGTFDWQHLTAPITPPKGAAQAKPLIIKWPNRGITGTFWVDNVVIREEGSKENLLRAGTFDEPEWKSGLLVPKGKDGSKCAKFVCTEDLAQKQQALWVDPDRKGVPVDPARKYVVELDLKAQKLGPPKETPIACLLFRVSGSVPEGTATIYTYALGTDGRPVKPQETELVVLPPLKNVRPKTARIAPCMYGQMFSEPVAKAYAENAWRSGITWTYGNIHNNIVPLLQPRGHRVWLAKPGHPFGAHGKAAREFIKQHTDVRAILFTGKPSGHTFCPTWLLSNEGVEVRKAMDDELVELVNRDGYMAVNWDIEQPVLDPPEKGFCFCERCLAAFRKESKLPAEEKLDPKAILEKHKEAWVMFRCRQNADLVKHCRTALKRCKQPIEFSVYSGYQCQKTREHYGVDWALLAPHLDLGIAGYGCPRKNVQATIKALGGVPFIGGENYYLSATPRPGATGWMGKSLSHRPHPETWRNQLLRQFVESGCNGVLIWYLPTMDGAAFYHTSEAAEIIATYEDFFRRSKRCDSSFKVTGMKPEHWAALEDGAMKMLLLFNFTKEQVDAAVEQPDLQGKWTVQMHGREGNPPINPAKFTHKIKPWGTAILIFRQAETK
ncbi:MAG: hypothetical protein GXP25_10130 [Planctomycetes bacterium]|nr:hypothetical protein [Planctomycetota bacterium]